MIRLISRFSALAAFAVATAPASARVVSATPAGFEITDTATVRATPAQAYAALAQIGRWWSDAHSYSGKAANMTLDPRAGGCFCETLPGGGSVEHGRVVLAWPTRHMLRLSTALGPLQGEGAAGALTWEIKAAGQGATIVQTYVVGGNIRGGAEKLAPLVDNVLSEQLRRLGSLLNAGHPLPK